jgi:hypothetical protein
MSTVSDRWKPCYVAWRESTAHELARSWHEHYPDREYRVRTVPVTDAQERYNRAYPTDTQYRVSYAVEVR